MKRIVVGFGGYGKNGFALSRGVEFAIRFGAELVVVYADTSTKISTKELEKIVESEIENILPKHLLPRRKLLVWRPVLYKGDIAKALMSTAEDTMADLVIIGESERRKLTNKLISEFSPRITQEDLIIRNVVHTSNTPVMIDKIPVERGINRILAVVDLSHESEHLLNYAGAIAREFMSDMFVLYVIGIPERAPLMGMRKVVEEYKDKAKEAFDSFIEKMKPTMHGLPLHTLFTSGDLAEQTIKTTNEKDIDLIICNLNRPTGWIQGMFGTPEEQIALTASCSVLLLPVNLYGYEEIHQTATVLPNG